MEKIAKLYCQTMDDEDPGLDTTGDEANSSTNDDDWSESDAGDEEVGDAG